MDEEADPDDGKLQPAVQAADAEDPQRYRRGRVPRAQPDSVRAGAVRYLSGQPGDGAQGPGGADPGGAAQASAGQGHLCGREHPG